MFAEQEAQLAGFFSGLTDDQSAHRYAEGKWSLKQLLGHATDTERVMSYRLLCISRGEQTPLPGFDENDYVRGAAFDRRPLRDLLAEFGAVRPATVALVRGLTAEQLDRAGTPPCAPAPRRPGRPGALAALAPHAPAPGWPGS